MLRTLLTGFFASFIAYDLPRFLGGSVLSKRYPAAPSPTAHLSLTGRPRGSCGSPPDCFFRSSLLRPGPIFRTRRSGVTIRDSPQGFLPPKEGLPHFFALQIFDVFNNANNGYLGAWPIFAAPLRKRPGDASRETPTSLERILKPFHYICTVTLCAAVAAPFIWSESTKLQVRALFIAYYAQKPVTP